MKNKMKIRALNKISEEELVKRRKHNEEQLNKRLSDLLSFVRKNKGPLINSDLSEKFIILDGNYNKQRNRAELINSCFSKEKDKIELSEYDRVYQEVSIDVERKNKDYIECECREIRRHETEAELRKRCGLDNIEYTIPIVKSRISLNYIMKS